MFEERVDHTATLLSDGGVLVAGGASQFVLVSDEIYDPVTGGFAPIEPR